MNLEIVVKVFEQYLLRCLFLLKLPALLQMNIMVGIFQIFDHNFGKTCFYRAPSYKVAAATFKIQEPPLNGVLQM